MKEQLRQLGALTIASLKMYYRSKSAVFFSLFMPLIIICLFGVILNNSADSKTNLGIVDYANNASSQSFIHVLNQTNAFKIDKGNYNAELASLKKGDRDLLIAIPQSFNLTNTNTTKNELQAYYDKSKAQNVQVTLLIIDNIISNFNQQIFSETHRITIPAYTSIHENGIQTNNLSGIDFLVPGVIGFSIMQGMLFGVAFSFTSMKKTGALKRLQATPAKPLYFIISQSISRLLLSIVQMLLLLYIGIFFFKLHMYGSIALFLLIVILGSLVFLGLGLAVAGYAKDENQAAPLINLISLPMTFLSGVFFPRSLMPVFLQKATDFFPLTYISDALHQIANNGAGIKAIQSDIIGLLIWAVIAIIIAVKLFKWE